MSATSSAGAPCARVKSERIWSANAPSAVGLPPSSGGRLRAELPMFVSTAPGTTADTLIGAPTIARSCARHSDAASAACFEIVYGPETAFEVSPAIDDVLTMCAGVPAAIMRGTNARIALRMPHRFTPSTHSKSAAERSHSTPPTKTPALLHRTSTEPHDA